VKQVGEETRLDQLISYLNENSDVEILDLRPSLIQAKDQGRLYERTGTHWNGHGAYIAYREIISRVSNWFPAIKPIPRSSFKVARKRTAGLDLAVSMGIENKLHEENIMLGNQLIRKMWSEVVNKNAKDAGMGARKKRYITKCRITGLPKAVIIRDSFTTRLMPFLSPSFSRIAYLWTNTFDSAEIIREKPDIVIHEVAERFLMVNPKKNIIRESDK